jgi:hypothetical protein
MAVSGRSMRLALFLIQWARRGFVPPGHRMPAR